MKPVCYLVTGHRSLIFTTPPASLRLTSLLFATVCAQRLMGSAGSVKTLPGRDLLVVALDGEKLSDNNFTFYL